MVTNTASSSGLTGVALITGAGSGIGAATARAFAAKGVSRLVLVDFAPAGLKTLEAELQSGGAQVLVVQADVSKEAEVKDAIAEAVTAFGRIDYCVNSAGTAALGALVETSTEDWNRVMGVNITGVFLCVREQSAQMLKQDPLASDSTDPKRQQRGSIINLASILGTVAVPGVPAYVASKHAVVGLAKAAAVEHAGHGIRTNNIAPGWIDTPMTNNAHVASVLEAQTQPAKTPAGRAGSAEEIADVAVFLSSTEASFVNGATWIVDGGFTSL
ncbi:3-oxoacyl-[acyl-carrier-protein] reductase FabG [Vanrija pseudolonga]|uniref:3-oxoacyl-[acyl-carrier-protein] reductase FabG n=1 Tax=Vanrija pseudolonga TaxID=143232 RepID=A0AAF0Y9M6_9TREE|nr:3-oxoacyl-[acyl-carrier-protein] reductase FabG [Vanrija pseudolonga]